VQFDKETILGMIKDPAQLEQAAKQLPDMIDHEQHGNLLQGLGINPQELLSKFRGGQGGN
jgi:hypothetical protein